MFLGADFHLHEPERGAGVNVSGSADVCADGEC
jgi:hypothetical protein